MEIMVNLPEDAAAREALARCAAQLHAEAIRGSLEALRCPEAQKKAVLNAILRAKQEGIGTITASMNTR